MQNTSVSERTTTPTCSAGDGTAVVGVHEVVRAGVAEVTRSGVHDVPRLHTRSLHPRYPKPRLNSVTLPAVRHDLTSLPARDRGRQDDSQNHRTYETGSAHHQSRSASAVSVESRLASLGVSH